MKHLPLVAVLLLASGGMSLIATPDDSGAPSPFNRMLWSGVYLLVCVLIYKRSQTVLSAVRLKPGFLILALLAVASSAWSADPARTIAHSMALFGSTLLAYLIAATVDPRTFLRMAALALGVVALGNVVIALMQGGGSMSALGRFSGSFTHPNTLGRVSALTILVCISLGMARLVRQIWWIVGVSAAGFLLLASNSVTSLVALAIALLVALVRSQIRGAISSGRLLVISWFGLCVGGTLWLFRWEVATAVLGALNRNPTLTGRTYLWDGVVNAIMQQPFLGYGYNAFWSSGTHVTEQVYNNAGWSTMSAHNGLLEIGLHVGLIGVAIFVATVLPVVVRAFACDTEKGQGLPRVFLPILVYLLTLGLTESAYMDRNSIQWILLVSIAIWIKALDTDWGSESLEALSDQDSDEQEIAVDDRERLTA